MSNTLREVFRMRKITHIDCFSGPGGICTGLKAAGLDTVLAIEKVESCVETYTANHNVPVIHKDIREVTENDIRKYVKGEVDLLTSGMPCETFSTAGSKSRSFYDHRQYLFLEAIRIAEIVNAKMILFENVPAIKTKKTEKHGDKLIVQEIFEQLEKHGYKYHVDVTLNAADFGVPQFRERYFILASKEQRDLKVPISNTENNYVTVRDALIDLPSVKANSKLEAKVYRNVESAYSKLMKDNEFWKLEKSKTELTYHLPPNHREGTLKRFMMIDQGEGLKDLFDKLTPEEIERLQGERVLPKKWYIQRNRRLKDNTPSVTVTSHCLDELLHPLENRSLTVREVARLQGFPDSYDFKGGPYICPHIYETQDKYEQIGDAVPPLLAYQWGLVIKEMLEVENPNVDNQLSGVL